MAIWYNLCSLGIFLRNGKPDDLIRAGVPGDRRDRQTRAGVAPEVLPCPYRKTREQTWPESIS
jgi:hypothetical protein